MFWGIVFRIYLKSIMDLKYYVLWSKDNKMVKNYLDKYYEKLKKDLETISNNWILTFKINNLLTIWDKNRDFILNPDQSSLINMILKPYDKYILEKSISKLEKEIDLYINWKISELTMNKWEIISWTQIRLTLEDNNPYNTFDTHPDHWNTWWFLSWWEKTQENWLEIYKKTFELLKIVDIWFYSELNQLIKKIIPLWTAKSIHNSGSFKECIWHLYLWYTIDSNKPEINNLEAIIHESSHNKLNLIKQFDPILLNDYTEKYYSAIRPDARHIHWVFIWYHAFAPTMYIIMKSYINWYLWNDVQWYEKIVLYYIKTKILQKVVKKYAILTEIWREISSEIDYVILQMDLLFKKLNPSNEIITRAKKRQIEHFNEVNKKYSYLEY